MTYVQRFPHLQLPVVELSGRTITLLLVVGLHFILVALIVDRLRTIRHTPATIPPAVVYLPEIREPVIQPNPLELVTPDIERFNIAATVPPIDSERPAIPQERFLDSRLPDGGSTAPVDPEPAVRLQPRQDPGNPIGRPAYPSQSVRLAESGVVVVNLCVDTTGRLTDIDLRQSSGYQRLDRAAISHLRKPSMRLLPGSENGVPVPMCTDLRIRFGFDPE